MGEDRVSVGLGGCGQSFKVGVIGMFVGVGGSGPSEPSICGSERAHTSLHGLFTNPVFFNAKSKDMSSLHV